MRRLARRLVAASQAGSDQHIPEAVLVNEKLGSPVTRFAGAAGFASLLRRALTLAKEEMPALRNVKVGGDGRLEGIEQLAAETGSRAAGVEAAVLIVAHLLGLLETLIGEPLTLGLLREAWPESSLDDKHS